MTVVTRTDYHAVTLAGRTVKTFDGADAESRAVAWAKSPETRRRFGLLEVHEVTVTITSERIYRPRAAKPDLRRVAA